MDTCKHDWYFIEGTERLQCRRCKTETRPTYAPYVPPKPVGAWVIDPPRDGGHGPCTMFHVFNKPTDEQIKNTEATFGWKWRDV